MAPYGLEPGSFHPFAYALAVAPAAAGLAPARLAVAPVVVCVAAVAPAPYVAA